MGKINSRAKGARGERAWRDFLIAHGIQARRGAQFQGGPDSPDVVADHPGWHAEVKNVECLSLYSAMTQATNDCGTRDRPYVAHKRNKHPWVVILRAEDFLQLLLKEKELAKLCSATLPPLDVNLTLSGLQGTPVVGVTTTTNASVTSMSAKDVNAEGTA